MLKLVNPKIVGLFANQKYKINPDKYYPVDLTSIVKQTALAIAIPQKTYCTRNESITLMEDLAWLPKSQMIGANIPGWILIQKAKEVRKIIIDDDQLMEALEKGDVLLSEFYVLIGGVTINLDADVLK